MRLACQQRLIDTGITKLDHPIGYKSLSRIHPQDVIYHNAPRRNTHKIAALQTLHTVGQPVHQSFQRPGRAVTQAQLQPAPGQQKEDEHRQRIKVNLFAKSALRVKSASGTDTKGDYHSQRHREVHADAHLHDIAQSVPEKWPAREEDHWQGQHPGGPA